MSEKLVKFHNCTILRDHKIVDDYLMVRNGKILDPEEVFFDEKRRADLEVDMGGALISPGFIDIQINGGFGVDFSHDLTERPEGLEKVARGILAHGVTAFCPTLVTSSPQLYRQILPLLRPRRGGPHGAEVIGAHLEGPFINKLKKGAHQLNFIADLNNGMESLEEMYGDLSGVKILTLAPEKSNSLQVIPWLTKRNITVCLGHSEAEVELGEEAIRSGARIITHLFNAMLPFHHRNPGLIGLLGTTCEREVYYGVIADGVHSHPASLRIAYRAHPKGVVLVTDAVSAMGLAEGVHFIGDLQIHISGARACIAGTQTLCGSIATLDACVRTFRKATECSLVEALEAASLHPATALGLQARKGSLNFGSDADFVALTPELRVLSTWIAGECVYRSS